jgi:hypothetical protein
VEEPSTASKADSCTAAKEMAIRSPRRLALAQRRSAQDVDVTRIQTN